METPSEKRDRTDEDEIRIGVSACLLGREVRFDGGHKLDNYLTEIPGRFVTYVPVCPEVELGLGVPRESIRLERKRKGQDVHLVAPLSGKDHTKAMRSYAARRAKTLSAMGLSGFVLKKNSPSCGLERVMVYGVHGAAENTNRGFFVEALMRSMPLLPLEEEERLKDQRLRENFWERVFAYRRLRGLFDTRWSLGDLVRFHTSEKLLVLAHETKAYVHLGRLVAGAKKKSRADAANEYSQIFMGGLSKIATAKKHTNVLQHAAGYFKSRLSPAESSELHGAIDEFRLGLLPLVVPITLLKHHIKVHGISYLSGQSYFELHHKEQMLRNHA